MDSQEQKNLSGEKDIDLGTLLGMIARGFGRLGQSIVAMLQGLAYGLLSIAIFFRRRLIWLLLAAAVGGVYGYFTSYKAKGYYSEMTARFNFGSSHALYSTLEYLNSLIEFSLYDELAQALSITKEEAQHLINFSAEPVEDEMVLSDLYKRNFLVRDRNYSFRTDTLWAQAIPYEKFKEMISIYDIPIHRVRVNSKVPNLFGKVEAGLLKQITGNKNLQSTYAISQQWKSEEEKIILGSLQSLDTLLAVYSDRLRNLRAEGNPATTVNVMSGSYTATSPEMQVYEKYILLKDELRFLRNFEINNREPVQVFAPMNPVGNSDNGFRQNVGTGILYALVITLVILLGIEAYKALVAYERRTRA